MTLTGEVVADIFASTTGSDNDMVVKLIDEYPDDDPDPKMRGYRADDQRGNLSRPVSCRASTSPTPLAPGSIHEYKFSCTTWITSSRPATP